ncbi:MAG: hypothetical protein J6Z11_16515 [Candidatus Riflebacteria bacterium]|nr:hypothetical protein [Candidatus Riflebacteria bacterium]
MENNDIGVGVSTATVTVSTTSPKLKEVPESFSYAVDIIYILLFFFVLFFIKPKANSAADELTEEEKPNPLEQVLRTDSVEESEELKDEKNEEVEEK